MTWKKPFKEGPHQKGGGVVLSIKRARGGIKGGPRLGEGQIFRNRTTVAVFARPVFNRGNKKGVEGQHWQKKSRGMVEGSRRGKQSRQVP